MYLQYFIINKILRFIILTLKFFYIFHPNLFDLL